MPEIFRNRQGTGAPPRSGEAPSGGETSVLFHKDGDQGHAFNQGRQRDGNHHNGGGSSGVASGGFRGFRTNEANAEAGADGDEAETYVAGQFGQGGHCDRINHVIGMVYVFC